MPILHKFNVQENDRYNFAEIEISVLFFIYFFFWGGGGGGVDYHTLLH